jgi:hypothetical protein
MSQSAPRGVDAYVVERTKCKPIHALQVRHALDVHSHLRLLPGLLQHPMLSELPLSS